MEDERHKPENTYISSKPCHVPLKHRLFNIEEWPHDEAHITPFMMGPMPLDFKQMAVAMVNAMEMYHEVIVC